MVAVSSGPVLRWFAPPRLATPEFTRRAHELWKISWAFFGLLTVILLAASVTNPILMARRLTSVMLVGVLVVILHALNRRGRTVLASWLLVLGLTAIVTQRAWHTGGVHSPIALFYMMFILIAAGLLGMQGSIVTAAASVISAAVLWVAEVAGLLTPPGPGNLAPAQPFVAAVLAVAVTVLALTLLLRRPRETETEDVVAMFVRDIRSPLTVMMTRLAILRADLEEDSEAVEDADAAMAETIRLSQMATNLLDISRPASKRPALERSPVDVARLATDVVHELRELNPSQPIEVRAPSRVICQCDVKLVRRIIENLLGNAIRRTAPEGRILAEVSHGEHGVRISVADDGAAISAEDREHVFEDYTSQQRRTLSGYHPVSLELAFCRLAATAHGGRIWVEDIQPRGSRFVVELPAS
jgi:signal transduction histidine kinase